MHPDLGISSKAMVIMDGLMNDMFERLVREVEKLHKRVIMLHACPQG